MTPLFKTLAEIAFELSADRIMLLADKTRELNTVEQIDSIRSAWGPNINKNLYDRFIKELKNNPTMTGKELSVSLVAALAVVQASETKGKLDLLWTGPTTSSVAIRQTEQAFCELIKSAKKRLFIVSYVAYKADIILNALLDASMRQVNIHILLENAKEHGGTVNIDSVKVVRDNLPLAHFYEWIPNQHASVHAKCAVADKDMALITSANLTGSAMNNNMEIGLLIHGGPLPNQLSSHLESLVTEKVITEITR